MAKFGVVVFGSSIFDFQSHLNNPRFKKSAEEFQRVIADKEILPDCEIDTLDLYDNELSTSDVIGRILKFTGGDHDGYILYYCGHGTVGIRETDYKILLRQTDKDNAHTLLNPNELLRDVKRRTRNKRVYLILDSCYAGAAVSETMRAGDEAVVIERRLQQVVKDGGRGTAVFTSTGKLGVAIAKEEDEVTLFTGAFVRCLREGISDRPHAQRFSWQDLRDEIIRVTTERLGADAPIPQLISYSESASDITRIDFFSNRAFVAQPAAPKPDEEPGITAIKLRLAEFEWRELKSSKDVAELKRFVENTPPCKVREDAKLRIEALQAEAKAAPPPPPPGLVVSARPATLLQSPPPLSPPSPRKWLAPLLGVVGLLLLAVLGYRATLPSETQPRVPDEPNIIADPSPSPSSLPVVRTTPQVRTTPTLSFDTFANHDTNGDVIRYFNSDSSECLSQCRADSSCMAFSFDKWKGKCYLLRGVGELLIDPKSDTSVRTDQARPEFSSAADSLCRYNGFSVSGESYRNVPVQTADDCRKTCEPDRDCLASMFSNRSCTMFRNLSGRQSGVSGAVTFLRMQTSC